MKNGGLSCQLSVVRESSVEEAGGDAVDYDAIVAPTGRHGFREEVASKG